MSQSLATFCALLTLLVIAPAQKKGKFKKAYWTTDPYTANNPQLMEKAGYVSYGPFTWADDHDTNDIKKMFPHLKMLFVETAHFKIAIALGNYKLPKGGNKKQALEKRLLKEQLTRLKAIMPKIKPTVRQLDPWLRLHLFALRLEDVYADFSKRIGVKDEDFPKNATLRFVNAGTPKGAASPYMGQGPYLGMRNKFLVLLMTKGGDLNRYVARVKQGLEVTGAPKPRRHYFAKVGSLFFGTACEFAENGLYNDHALHCHIVFITVQSLIDGYKDFFFSLPVWIREGLSQWYALRIDPTESTFTDMKGRSNTKRYGAKWPSRIKKRLKHNDFTPAAEVMKFMQFNMLTFGDHLAIWSRVDYLQTLDNEKFAKFMGTIKNQIAVEAGQQPKPEEILAQQEKALRDAYGFDYAGFDRAWRAFVLKTYPNK